MSSFRHVVPCVALDARQRLEEDLAVSHRYHKDGTAEGSCRSVLVRFFESPWHPRSFPCKSAGFALCAFTNVIGLCRPSCMEGQV